MPEIVGGRLGGAATAIVNAGSEALAAPSLTLITMLAKLPAAVGVPASRPVVVLNVAQLGRFAIAKVSVAPSGSLASGETAYAAPSVAVVGGGPEIVGGRFGAASTGIASGGSVALAVRSLTLFTIFFAAVETTFPLGWAVVGDLFGRKHYAKIRGYMVLFYTWGGVLGPVIAGAIFDRWETYEPLVWSLVGVFILAGLFFESLNRSWKRATGRI